MIFRLKNNCDAPGSLITCIVSKECTLCFNKKCTNNNEMVENRKPRYYHIKLFEIKYNEIGELDTELHKYKYIQINYKDNNFVDVALFTENTIFHCINENTLYYEFNGINDNI